MQGKFSKELIRKTFNLQLSFQWIRGQNRVLATYQLQLPSTWYEVKWILVTRAVSPPMQSNLRWIDISNLMFNSRKPQFGCCLTSSPSAFETYQVSIIIFFGSNRTDMTLKVFKSSKCEHEECKMRFKEAHNVKACGAISSQLSFVVEGEEWERKKEWNRTQINPQKKRCFLCSTKRRRQKKSLSEKWILIKLNRELVILNDRARIEFKCRLS